MSIGCFAFIFLFNIMSFPTGVIPIKNLKEHLPTLIGSRW